MEMIGALQNQIGDGRHAHPTTLFRKTFMKPDATLPDPLTRPACTKIVNTFEELVTTPLDKTTNALCWQRELSGDFYEIADRLSGFDEIVTVEETDLLDLALSVQGQAARDILIRDQQLLREYGLDPILDCIPTYPKETDPSPVPTDVYSFHVDTATVKADTFLCSYNLASSEGLANHEAVRRVDIRETRAELLELYGGQDDDVFIQFLKENCFDLHYLPLPGATPYSFGLGNIWRIATDYPGNPALPCIHRAPTTLPGLPPRLLLIS